MHKTEERGADQEHIRSAISSVNGSKISSLHETLNHRFIKVKNFKANSTQRVAVRRLMVRVKRYTTSSLIKVSMANKSKSCSIVETLNRGEVFENGYIDLPVKSRYARSVLILGLSVCRP